MVSTAPYIKLGPCVIAINIEDNSRVLLKQTLICDWQYVPSVLLRDQCGILPGVPIYFGPPGS